MFCVVRVWRRLYRIRERKRSVALIIKFATMIDQADAMKSSVTKFSLVLKSMVPRIRHYLVSKRRRVSQMEAQWAAYEDRLLAAHFKRIRDAVIREAKAAKKTAGQEEDVAMQIIEQGGAVNWKAFRVPLEMRRKKLVHM